MDSATLHRLQAHARHCLAQGQPAQVVTVTQVQGSTPREVGAMMLVTADAFQGTIGGGHLEWQALARARELLKRPCPTLPATRQEQHFALGPTLGQCCGGTALLRFEPLLAETMAVWPANPARFHLELHGAGHVGQAIVHLLRDIDCTVRWIDERGEQDRAEGLPSAAALADLPPHIQWLASDDAAHEAGHTASAGACHLVLTHQHDLDLRIVSAVLARHDARWIGLIGSQTKRARFLHRLQVQGFSAQDLASLHCPIGLPSLNGKEPAVIAISVVAQLLQHCPASGPSLKVRP